jgi:hypothetical protein
LIDPRQRGQEVFEIDPHACFFLQKRAYVKAYPHLGVMYSLGNEKSRQGTSPQFEAIDDPIVTKGVFANSS